MFFSTNGKYSSILELMHYFYFEFNVYIMLLIIIFINFLKAFLSYRRLLDKKEGICIQFTDLITSIICGIALLSAIFFQGVIADIASEASAIWFKRVFAVCIVSSILFVGQLYLYAQIIKNEDSDTK